MQNMFTFQLYVIGIEIVENGSTVYFAKTVLGNDHLAQNINSVTNIAQIITMFLIAPIIKKIGKRNAMVIGLIIQSIGLGLLVLLGMQTFGIYFSSIVRGVGGAFSGAVMWAMVSDNVDYGEWKTGLRMEGLTNSACSFGYKVGNGLGSALLGLVLSLGGYVGGSVVQSQEAIVSIHIVFWILPIFFTIVVLVLLHFYKLDNEFPEIVADLQERRNYKK